MSAAKRAIAIGAVALLGGAVAGGLRATGEAQRIKREQAFADLSQCLFGERVESPEAAATAMSGMQARGAHLTYIERWPENRIPWPQRCEPKMKELVVAVRESHFLGMEAKRLLLVEARTLLDDLNSPQAQTAALERSVLGLWRVAENHQLEMAATSSVVGPPKTERARISLEALELPFTNILPVDGGPVWHFLATRKDTKALASCVPSETGLVCRDLESDGALLPWGTWESPSYIPVRLGERLRLLVDGRLEDPGIPNGHGVHVDESGTVYAMTLGSEELLIKPRGKEVIVVRVDEAAAKYDMKDLRPIWLVGEAFVASDPSSKSRMFRFPIAPEGTLGAPKEAPFGNVCRAGQSYAFSWFVGPGSTLVFLERDVLRKPVDLPPGALAGSVSAPKKGPRRAECSASGAARVGERSLCRPTGCIAIFDDVSYSLFLENVQAPPVLDMVGDRVVYMWGAKEGRGLLVHVGDPGFTAKGKDVLVVDKTGDEGPQKMGVFGGEKAALAVAEVEDKLVGFVITASGEVSAAKVEWK